MLRLWLGLISAAWLGAQSGPDPLLALARRAASEYGTSLPDYVCQEKMERYNVTGTTSFRAQPKHLDTVKAEVVYEHGKENFRNLSVDGKPVEQVEGGVWSIGVFGPMMASIFEPRIDATFRRRGTGREGGHNVVRYDFTVAEANSNWLVTAVTQARPPYQGSIWVDTETGRVLRHEIATTRMPVSFYYQRAELKVRYRFVMINGTEYLLPQSMESVLCPRGYVFCDRVEAAYSGCRKFGVESTLKFDLE